MQWCRSMGARCGPPDGQKEAFGPWWPVGSGIVVPRLSSGSEKGLYTSIHYTIHVYYITLGYLLKQAHKKLADASLEPCAPMSSGMHGRTVGKMASKMLGRRGNKVYRPFECEGAGS